MKLMPFFSLLLQLQLLLVLHTHALQKSEERQQQQQQTIHNDGVGVVAPHDRTLTRSTWIVTATTPFPEHRQSNYLGYKAYQHWTCYHPSNATVPQLNSAKDKLFCCQKIFQQIIENAGYAGLCYEQGKCSPKKQQDRTDFLHLCNKLITHVPRFLFLPTEEAEEEEAEEIKFYPQLTVILEPGTDKLYQEEDSINKPWRQFMWVSTSSSDSKKNSDLPRGRFLDPRPKSPLHLAIDPKSFLHGGPSKSSLEAENKKKKNFFQAGLQTSVGVGSFQAERLLQHTLKLYLDNIHNTTITTSSLDSWKATLQVLIFAPIDLSLRTKNLLSSCSATKPSITASCQVVPTYDHQKSNPAVPEVHSFTVTIQGNSSSSTSSDNAADGDDAKASNSNIVKVKWTTRVLLDDEDEDLIVPAPVILDGRLAVTTTRTTPSVNLDDDEDGKSHLNHSDYYYYSSDLSWFQPPLTTLLSEEGTESLLHDEL